LDLKKLIGNVPWITEEGFLDPAKLPIENVLKQAISKDLGELRSGLCMLQSMYAAGRKEAGVFLLGLLVNCDDDWENRGAIVDTLRGIKTKPCADLLFGELKRFKSSRTTRRYLAKVIEALSYMPRALVREGFESLIDDKSFSERMRDKFRVALARSVPGDGVAW
jgi:hypothetical protein